MENWVDHNGFSRAQVIASNCDRYVIDAACAIRCDHETEIMSSEIGVQRPLKFASQPFAAKSGEPSFRVHDGTQARKQLDPKALIF